MKFMLAGRGELDFGCRDYDPSRTGGSWRRQIERMYWQALMLPSGAFPLHSPARHVLWSGEPGWNVEGVAKPEVLVCRRGDPRDPVAV